MVTERLPKIPKIAIGTFCGGQRLLLQLPKVLMSSMQLSQEWSEQPGLPEQSVCTALHSSPAEHSLLRLLVVFRQARGLPRAVGGSRQQSPFSLDTGQMHEEVSLIVGLKRFNPFLA